MVGQRGDVGEFDFELVRYEASVAGGPVAPVGISKGGSAQGQPGCSSSACRYINASGSNFAAGQTVAVECQESSSGAFATYYTINRTADGNGQITWNGCYYGFSGRQVHVVMGGVASNVITW